MKKADREYIEAEEKEFLGKIVEDRFVEPTQHIADYDSINVKLIYKPNYKEWVKANSYTAFTTWDTEPYNPVTMIHEAGTFEDQEAKLLYMLKQRPISAVLESAIFQFKITGLPRSMTHQIVRHRGMSFNQESFRVSSCYSCPVRAPRELYEKKDKALLTAFENAVMIARRTYKQLVEAGVPIEQARNIMPMGTLTKITATMRLRDVIDYFKARTLDISQDEHTYLVALCMRELKDQAPEFYKLVSVYVKDIEQVQQTYLK